MNIGSCEHTSKVNALKKFCSVQYIIQTMTLMGVAVIIQ